MKLYKNILEKRFSETVIPAHMLAHVLHPQLLQDCPKKQEEIVLNYVAGLSPNFLLLIISFQVEAELFLKTFFFEKVRNINVRTWWKALNKNDHLPAEFIIFGMRLIHITVL